MVGVLFFDVDTQHDFLHAGGARLVPGADLIVPNLQKLTRFAVRRGIPILATAETRRTDDEDFAHLPPHCIRGTRGQQKIRATRARLYEVVPPDDAGPAAAWLHDEAIEQLVVEKRGADVVAVPAVGCALALLAPRTVFVYGVLLEETVRRAVLSLIEGGRRTTVVSDAVASMDERLAAAALADMEAAGAGAITTDALCSASIGTLEAWHECR